MVKTTEQKIVFSSPEGAKITKAKLKISEDGKNAEIIITTEQQFMGANIDNLDESFPSLTLKNSLGIQF